MKIKNFIKKLSARELADLVKLDSNQVVISGMPESWIFREAIYFAKIELIKRGY